MLEGKRSRVSKSKTKSMISNEMIMKSRKQVIRFGLMEVDLGSTLQKNDGLDNI